MQSMKSPMNNHSMKVLDNTAQIKENYNCRNKSNCPIDGKCLAPSISEPKITSNRLNYKEKNYTGPAETDFKHRFNSISKSFNLEQYENDTELTKEYWVVKRNHFTPKFTWRITIKCATLNTTEKKCYLCLDES